MATLICDYAPLDYVAKKIKNPNGILNGAAIAHANIARALLKYGRFERYIFLERNTIHSSPRESYPLLEVDREKRGQIATLPELARMDVSGPLVFLTPSPILHGLYDLQNAMGRYDSPCVGMIHSLCGSTHLPYLLGAMIRQASSAEAIICSSESGRRVLQNQLEHLALQAGLRSPAGLRLPVIPLGVDGEYFEASQKKAAARREYGFSDDEVVLLSIGRFSTRTKADLRPLMIAFSELLKQCRVPLRLALAGNDTEERMTRSLLRFSQSLGIEANLQLMPDIQHQEKLKLLAAADVFLAPSDNLQETFGLSVIEAMAAGLPVVASDWNGYRHLVAHGETGMLAPTMFPRYDFPIEALSSIGGVFAESLLAQTTAVDVPALTSAIKFYIENPYQRLAAGERAGRRAREQYHIAKVVADYEALWEDLIEESSGRPRSKDPSSLFSYSPYQVFDLYATRTFSGSETIVITELGEMCLEEESDLLAQIAGTERMFRRLDLKMVLGEIKEGPRPFVEIESRLCDEHPTPHVTRIAARAAIFRLVKFGLAAVVETRPGALDVRGINERTV